MEKPIRNLDTCYFRAKRDGKWESLCFTDLTEGEQKEVTSGKLAEWLQSLCLYLADRVRAIGDEFDIIGETEYS
ncbi:MAG: hypothetical protein IJS45_04130 [Clostridia bacterium]|nr:hypothetical protein [Clostridia bacterium]